MKCWVLIWHPKKDLKGHPVEKINSQYNGLLNQPDLTEFLQQQLTVWCSKRGLNVLSFTSDGFGIAEALGHAFWIGKWGMGESADTATLEMIW